MVLASGHWLISKIGIPNVPGLEKTENCIFFFFFFMHVADESLLEICHLVVVTCINKYTMEKKPFE